jgi:beta-xylosidase
MFGRLPSWVGVVQSLGMRQVTFAAGGHETAGGPVPASGSVILRMQVDDESVQYSYSADEGKTFRDIGARARMMFSWWKAARPAVFTFNTGSAGGRVDFDWLRVVTGTSGKLTAVKQRRGGRNG